MKTHLARVAALCGTVLLAGLPVGAQTSRSSGAVPQATTSFSQDAKEKSEDAALLKQLEGDQPGRNESKPKRSSGRGGGGLGVGQAGVSYHVENMIGHPTSVPRALVIRTSEPDPKGQASMEEDLAVMSHILTKSLEDLPGGPGNGNKILGIDVFFAPGAAPLRSMYLDNYGAVFFMNVNFPLVAPAEKKIEEKPVTDSTTWEDARQELYGQKAGAGPGEVTEDYSQDKVDRLKDVLFEALKNATNIRGLGPQEFVTVWVCGGSSAGVTRTRLKGNAANNWGGNVMALEPLSAARQTVLTIRASKSEIDAYAKGKLSLQDFQKHARVTSYTGDGVGGSVELLGVGNYTGRARF